MDIQVVNTIIDYTQNLKSSEDVITGILATILKLYPAFTKKFIKELKITTPIKDHYYLDTGYSITNYRWCEGVGIKPDLMISDIEEEWDKDIAPINENLILIESKLWASLPKKQEQSYKIFRDICKKKNTIVNILISIKKIDTNAFDRQFTWNQIINISEDIYSDLEGQIEEISQLRELIDFMKVRLIPSIDDFKNDNGNLCPKEILKRIKYRLKSNFFKPIQKPTTVSSVYDENELTVLNECLNLSETSQFSYILFNLNEKEYSICCGVTNDNSCIFWIEDENMKDLKILMKTNQINLDDKSWGEKWFEALIEINEFVTNLKNCK